MNPQEIISAINSNPVNKTIIKNYDKYFTSHKGPGAAEFDLRDLVPGTSDTAILWLVCWHKSSQFTECAQKENKVYFTISIGQNQSYLFSLHKVTEEIKHETEFLKRFREL